MLVATATATAAGDDKLFAVEGEIVELLAGEPIENDSAEGDFDDEGVAVAPCAIGTLAVAATVGGVIGVHAEVEKGVVVA